MIGFIKCDICGRFFSDDEHEKYDGLMPFYYDDAGIPRPLNSRSKYITDSDNNNADVPQMIDMCNNCFDKFVNWVRLCKADAGKQKEVEND